MQRFILSSVNQQRSSITTSANNSKMKYYPSPEQLLPFAPCMRTLLQTLQDQPFPDVQRQSTPDSASSTGRATAADRSPTLATLMQIIQDQADHDGFRIITINAEPRRVIMACNRQGKAPTNTPPSSGSATPNLPLVQTPTAVDDDTASNAGDDATAGRRNGSGRSGSSIRCGCRMRVNINFHSKMNAWRITSFEAEHNHALRKEQPEVQEPVQFQITPEMIRQSIQTYMRIHSIQPATATPTTATSGSPMLHQQLQHKLPPMTLAQPMYRPSLPIQTGMPMAHAAHPIVSPATQEREAIAVLAGMAQPSPPVAGQKRSSIDMTPPPSAHSPPMPSSNSTAGSDDQPRRPNKIIVVRRNSVCGTGSAGSPNMSTRTPYIVSARSDGQSATPMMAAGSVELDRYAMLHQGFKRLIAVACRRRSWTQEVLNGIGRFMEHLQQGSDEPLVFAPVHGAVAVSPVPISSAVVSEVPEQPVEAEKTPEVADEPVVTNVVESEPESAESDQSPAVVATQEAPTAGVKLMHIL